MHLYEQENQTARRICANAMAWLTPEITPLRHMTLIICRILFVLAQTVRS